MFKFSHFIQMAFDTEMLSAGLAQSFRNWAGDRPRRTTSSRTAALNRPTSAESISTTDTTGSNDRRQENVAAMRSN